MGITCGSDPQSLYSACVITLGFLCPNEIEPAGAGVVFN
jgi:hypothetical protein